MVRYTQLYGLLSTKQTLHVSFAERIAQNQAVFQDEILGRFELYLSFVRNWLKDTLVTRLPLVQNFYFRNNLWLEKVRYFCIWRYEKVNHSKIIDCSIRVHI